MAVTVTYTPPQYSGTVSYQDTTDDSFFVLSWELDGEGTGPAHRTGNLLVQMNFVFSRETANEHYLKVEASIPAAQFASKLIKTVTDAGLSAMASVLGL